MVLNRDEILKVLGLIVEPDLKKDIVSANLIDTLEIIDGKVKLRVLISNPAMHARKRMSEAINFNLKREFSENLIVDLEVAGMSSESKSTFRKILPEVKNIIAIASGKGGVGKSTATVNIAAGLTKLGHRVGIVDADIYGPSIPTMLDVFDKKPDMIDIDGVPKINPVLSYGIKILSIGFFTEQDSAVVWRGPMASKALTQMFTDAYWGELDYLLIDLPPGTGDIHLSLVQTVPLDGAIIVSTPQEVALADARRAINMFNLDSINIPVIGLLENMSWFTPEELPENKYYIFGRDGAKNLALGMGVPFLGHIPLIQSVRESADVGRPAVFQEKTIISNLFDKLVVNLIEQINSSKEKNKKNVN